MKRKFLLMAQCCLMAAMASAQSINGDLNHNDRLDVGDVTKLVDNMLTGQKEYVSGCTCKDTTIQITMETRDQLISVNELDMEGGWLEGPVEISFLDEVLNILIDGETLPVLDKNGSEIGTVTVPSKHIMVNLPRRIEGNIVTSLYGRARIDQNMVISGQTISIEVPTKK